MTAEERATLSLEVRAGNTAEQRLAQCATTILLAADGKSWEAIRRQTGVSAAQARDAGGSGGNAVAGGAVVGRVPGSRQRWDTRVKVEEQSGGLEGSGAERASG